MWAKAGYVPRWVASSGHPSASLLSPQLTELLEVNLFLLYYRRFSISNIFCLFALFPYFDFLVFSCLFFFYFPLIFTSSHPWLLIYILLQRELLLNVNLKKLLTTNYHYNPMIFYTTTHCNDINQD